MVPSSVRSPHVVKIGFCDIGYLYEYRVHRCTLRWEPSSDDGGADVRHYVLEYFRDVWNVWLKAKTTKDCQVAVDDLIPGSRLYRKPIGLLSPLPTIKTGPWLFRVKFF